MVVVWILHSLSTVDVNARRSTRHLQRFIRHFNHLHRAATLAAAQRRGQRFGLWRMTAGQPVPPAQEQPHQPFHFLQLHLRVGTHPAVVTDLLKSLGQDVLSKSHHELAAGDRACDRRFGFGRPDGVADQRVVD